MAPLTGPRRLMTVKAWSEELGCNPETLRRAIRRRQLLATFDPLSKGPGYVIAADDMAAFLDKRRRGA